MSFHFESNYINPRSKITIVIISEINLNPDTESNQLLFDLKLYKAQRNLHKIFLMDKNKLYEPLFDSHDHNHKVEKMSNST